MPGPEARYEIRRFHAEPGEGAGASRTAEWIRAVNYGFYQKAVGEDLLRQIVDTHVADDRELTGAYEVDASSIPGFGPDRPVATFATLRKTLNVGYGRLVPAHLVTAVTVRTDHRRRGLLRRLMGEDLARAKADGVPVAALTASEASIYRRFGYGVATLERRITVDTGPRFALAVKPRGRVLSVDPPVMRRLAPEIFALAHGAVPGSIDRQERYRLRAAGEWAEETGGPDSAARVAVHVGEDGRPDGYAAYSFRGWSHEPPTMDLCDLVAATPDAYLGLWEFLGSLDLVERVAWDEAPVQDPLSWALVDPRVLKADGAQDMLWLRILDVAAALQGRRFAHDGALLTRIDDPLGLTSGRYRVSVASGECQVERVPDDDPSPDDLTMDIAELSSVYIGGVSPVLLAEAGRIRSGEHSPEAALTLERMLAVERAPHCSTHF
ncbi:UPF0256 protein [Sinomonas cellulolyticus]|uniref:GNAT family N-acetyltransferase n=1 Tax=Sinomonas cellulolyticus TaxID=2801916 RepID=A0ABS1K1F1_9MICC|nr:MULTISPECIES: GNAT family N-acetyltransferase [Sinomonas]MBL0705384.1 GNAT family N-acetyltransferase [Sinomonas cellulolyticus]GHG40867.1 UPF0256 protein [Sinomonas sp. KCTC 49339]